MYLLPRAYPLVKWRLLPLDHEDSKWKAPSCANCTGWIEKGLSRFAKTRTRSVCETKSTFLIGQPVNCLPISRFRNFGESLMCHFCTYINVFQVAVDLTVGGNFRKFLNIDRNFERWRQECKGLSFLIVKAPTWGHQQGRKCSYDATTLVKASRQKRPINQTAVELQSGQQQGNCILTTSSNS